VKEELITAPEAQKYLRICKITLYKLINTKKLPALRVGRQWRFRKSELDKWLNRR